MSHLEEYAADDASGSAVADAHSANGEHDLLRQLDEQLVEDRRIAEGDPRLLHSLLAEAEVVRASIESALTQVNGSGLSWKEQQRYEKQIRKLLHSARQQARAGNGNSQAAERARQAGDVAAREQRRRG